MVALVPNVTGDDVGLFVGRGDDVAFCQGPGQVVANLARSAASAYCRGRGFEDPTQTPERLRTTVLMRAVRLLGNPQQLLNEARDGVTMSYGAAGQGFTYQETITLNDFRRTAASV